MTQNQPAQTPGKKSNSADRVGLVVGAALVLLILVFQWFQSVMTDPIATIPPIKTPNPNAYDLYLKASDSIQNRKEVEGLSFRSWYLLQIKGDLTLDRAEKLLDQNRKPLELMRQGMIYDYVEPIPARYFKSPGARVRMIDLINLLVLDASAKTKREDWQGLVSDELDRMQFIKSIVNSDLSNKELTPLSSQDFLRFSKESPIDHLTATQCREDIARLEIILANERSLEALITANKWRNILKMEAVFNELNGLELESGETMKSWFGDIPCQELISFKSRSRRGTMQQYLRETDTSVSSLNQNNPGFGFNGTMRFSAIDNYFTIDPQNLKMVRINGHLEKTRLLLMLAVHSYKLEHGDFPTELKALAPKYLHRLPDDPSSSGKPVRDSQFSDLLKKK